jgi:hypothetical protein
VTSQCIVNRHNRPPRIGLRTVGGLDQPADERRIGPYHLSQFADRQIVSLRQADDGQCRAFGRGQIAGSLELLKARHIKHPDHGCRAGRRQAR